MEFTYEALNRQGQSVTGKVVAESQTEAYEKLREAGVVVTNLSELKTKAKKKGGKKVAGFEMTPDMMTMMNGFTVLRLLSMAGGMMNVKFTKEDFLNSIKF